ncbi:MAG: hypothetical protein ACOXZK_00360 [Bacteroidales bacterium]|jgi:hypothetical protein|nr:hypothetical protein [Bacteroidales bacterium]
MKNLNYAKKLMKRSFSFGQISFVLLSLFLFLQINYSVSQNVVTIGEGETASKELPISINYGFSNSQQIYLQSEIARAGEISAIALNMLGGIDIEHSNEWEIYLAHTSKDYFENDADFVHFNEFTKVYSGTIDEQPAAGWYEIEFNI